jgi:endonuclease/exonuclease/phosphatase family metal-dependent hydrolase
MRIRVVTLNVWNGEGDSRRTDLINREIHRLDPDLVAFQEVLQTDERRQLEELLAGTALHATHQRDVLGHPLPAEDRYGGTALASRWPHEIVETLDLRVAEAPDVPWCTLAAHVSVPDEGTLLFVATTTAWRLDAEAARERQVLALTDADARHRQQLPTIIAGDFNAAPDAASIRYMTGLQALSGRSVHYHDSWVVAGHGPGHTWTTKNPNAASVAEAIIRQAPEQRRIDYVFVGSWHAHPHAHARVLRAALMGDEPIDGVWASDHFGVVVDLDIGSDA